jgi:hypothetical protein
MPFLVIRVFVHAPILVDPIALASGELHCGFFSTKPFAQFRKLQKGARQSRQVRRVSNERAMR